MLAPTSKPRPYWHMRAVVLAASLTAASTLCCSPIALGVVTPAAQSSAVSASMRRLDEVQYKRSIEDIFGPGITTPGRFEPPRREDGLLAIGNSHVVITPSGFEQYELNARDIAAQVLSADRRGSIMPCVPRTSTPADTPCARRFLKKYGRLLFRRPLSTQELISTLNLTRVATQKSGDFYTGLQFGLARLLISPNFLFRIDVAEVAPNAKTAPRLDDYSLASRISFLLWNAPPDEQLLDAAARGELRQPADLEREVDRMIASSRFEQGVRAFFSDMLSFDDFDGLSKDQSIFPKYNSQLSKDAQEQTLRMIVDALVTQHGDYRDLFTTRQTVLNRNLGSLYKVPVVGPAFDGWMPYTFDASDPRGGILTAAAFLLLDPTHEGRSSPTIRGKKVRELLLCQKVPSPPPNVNFRLVQDTRNPLYRTARDRLSAHRDNPVCAGCHALMDPVGLSMENFDAIGEYRAQENGAAIDASGTFEGKPYQDLLGLEQLMHDSPAVANCVARRAYEYGVGHSVTPDEHDWIKSLDQSFAAMQYEFPALMRQIATSDALRELSPDPTVPAGSHATTVASN